MRRIIVFDNFDDTTLQIIEKAKEYIRHKKHYEPI